MFLIYCSQQKKEQIGFCLVAHEMWLYFYYFTLDEDKKIVTDQTFPSYIKDLSKEENISNFLKNSFKAQFDNYLSKFFDKRQPLAFNNLLPEFQEELNTFLVDNLIYISKNILPWLEKTNEKVVDHNNKPGKEKFFLSNNQKESSFLEEIGITIEENSSKFESVCFQKRVVNVTLEKTFEHVIFIKLKQFLQEQLKNFINEENQYVICNFSYPSDEEYTEYLKTFNKT